MNLISLQQAKDWLNISGTGNDVFLESLRRSVSDIIETYCQKPMITRQLTEYQDGSGVGNLQLHQYPAYVVLDASFNPSNVTLYVDTDRVFGSSTLIGSDSYYIREDEGLISLYNDESVFTPGIANVKIIYWAGFSRFEVLAGVNDKIDITDTGGTSVITLTADQYNAQDLATEIQTKLNADATLAGTYTVTYNFETFKFKIASTVNFQLLFSSGANINHTARFILGFNSTDTANGTSAESDNSISGLPDDLILAAQKLVLRYYEDSAVGKSRQEVISETIASGGTRSFLKNQLPVDVKMILDKYGRKYW